MPTPTMVLRDSPVTLGWKTRYVISLVAYYLGLNALYREIKYRRHGGRALILAYHSVRSDLDYCGLFVSPELLREQVRALKTSYRFVTIEELMRHLRRGRLDENLAALTFDDGYRDNLNMACPVLTDEGVRFTTFVTTRNIDSGEPTLFLAITLIIDRSRRVVLNLPSRALHNLPLRTHSEQEVAIQAVDAIGKPLGWDERHRLIRELADALDVDIASGLLDGQMLSWDEVRVLASRGVEIGAHSVSHAVLCHLDECVARNEIAESVARTSEALGTPCRLFAYPYGLPDECGPREVSICRDLGLVAAVTLRETEPDGAEPFTLGRVMPTRDRFLSPSGKFSSALFACETSGLMAELRRITTSPS